MEFSKEQLEVVYELRPDLQEVFEHPEAGGRAKPGKGNWTLTDWARSYGIKENPEILIENKLPTKEIRKTTNKKHPKVEIVIVKFNLPEAEAKCIELVKRHTHNFKLTVIDNYKNKESLSKVWNDAIKKSKCKYVCLLNNDAFVTEGWLEELMGGFLDDQVAAVGPCGDNVGGIQRGFTEKQADQWRGVYEEVPLLSGYCMVARTDLPFIFPLEVPFYGGEHAWEVQAKRLGYRFIWAKGAFVAHLGEASGKKEGNIEELRKQGQLDFVKWLAETTPVLYTTYNRLEYTKKTLPQLLKSICGRVIVIDNSSTDGTREYLKSLKSKKLELILLEVNRGVAGAMNVFFEKTANEYYVAKVDNDTIVPKDWLINLLGMATWRKIDIVQARHPILHHSFDTFEEWAEAELTQDKLAKRVYYSNYVGGSGVAIKRDKITTPLTEGIGPLKGWTEFQSLHPELKKAFCLNVEVELLDMVGDNEPRYSDYADYYREVGRSELRVRTIEQTLPEIITRLGSRFAYTRFGDGELQMIDGWQGRDITQFNNEKFQKELTECFMIDHPDFLIGNMAGVSKEAKSQPGMFEPFQNDRYLKEITARHYAAKTFYNPFVFHYLYKLEPMLWRIFKRVLSKHKVGFVGGEHLKPLKSKLGISDFVVTPSTQAYNTIDEWYPQVEVIAKRNDILLLSLGPTANVVQKRLWQKNIKVGTIDLGSVANALCGVNPGGHTWIEK